MTRYLVIIQSSKGRRDTFDVYSTSSDQAAARVLEMDLFDDELEQVAFVWTIPFTELNRHHINLITRSSVAPAGPSKWEAAEDAKWRL